ncbi:hypothetical protein F5X68DRAFT_242241 [Plectosphaerella plurivora]|uniref:Uncharacterized protein n=1 Tax=Plectosphaerella plurivora TaxID=936078 RepID=A0A9P8VAA3_9PEZI|nr:hypothetical protein F5X68DRAFT_242241 [Plectosphaerella plurivora]
MFRSTLFSLSLTAGLVSARPDRLRGRSYANPNTCPCPPGPTATDGSQPNISVTTIQETVTAIITVTLPAPTHTIYETITQEVYGSDAVTHTKGPEVVTITRTIVDDAGHTTISGENIDTATYQDKTLTVTYDDAGSKTTWTRDSYETRSPIDDDDDDKYPVHDASKTSNSAAPHATVTGGGQGYEGGKKDDAPYDDNVDKNGNGKDDHDYDDDHPVYHDGGSKTGDSKPYPENTSKPSPTDDGSRGYPDDPSYPDPKPNSSGDSTKYETVYISPSLSPASTSAPGCSIGTKIVTEYETIFATVRPTSSSSSNVYETSASHTYETAAPNPYNTARTNSTTSVSSSSFYSSTNSAAAQPTSEYLQYAKREPQGRSRKFGFGWW